MKKAFLLLAGASLFGGCYAGLDTEREDASGERYGDYCYYSYASAKGGTAKASSSSSDANSARADGKFQLTAEVGPESGPVADNAYQVALLQLRTQAGSIAPHYVQQECWEAEDLDNLCTKECDGRGLRWDSKGQVLCDDCKLDANGDVDCPVSKSLRDALRDSWDGREPWRFSDQEMQVSITVFPPVFDKDERGNIIAVSDVRFEGFCFCACTPE